MSQNNRSRGRNGRTPVKRTGHQNEYRPQKKRKKSILPRAILVFGGFATVIALAFLLVGEEHIIVTPNGDLSADSAVENVAPTATPEVAEAVAPTVEATVTPESTEDAAQVTLLAEITQAQKMLDDAFMILVSVDSVMPDGYVVEEKLADSTTGKTLQTTAADAYIEMAAAAAEDGVTLRLQSAYRSVSYQAMLFENQIQKWIGWGYSEEEATINAATVVNPAGASEHNCGLAADINCPEYLALEEGFEETDAFAWLVENAAAYGYILRYPKEDQEITGITYEPWHWRYVGVENAAIINESGLCLESFLLELEAITNSTSTSDVITGTAAFQAAMLQDDAVTD